MNSPFLLNSVFCLRLVHASVLSVHWDSTYAFFFSETVSIDLYVLATDYITYSLAYSCQNVNDYQRARE